MQAEHCDPVSISFLIVPGISYLEMQDSENTYIYVVFIFYSYNVVGGHRLQAHQAGDDQSHDVMTSSESYWIGMAGVWYARNSGGGTWTAVERSANGRLYLQLTAKCSSVDAGAQR